MNLNVSLNILLYMVVYIKNTSIIVYKRYVYTGDEMKPTDLKLQYEDGQYRRITTRKAECPENIKHK